MEPLRPATPNPTGMAAIEPPTLGSQPLYPQFLRPLGAESLTVNNPSLFFPDGVPGYEPMTNPYTTSPFFPAIPEAPVTVATPPAPNPLPALPQIPALLDTQLEELEEEIAEAPSNIPNISAILEEPTETPQPQDASDARLQVPAQTNELPSERSSTVPPTPSIAPQSILETEASVLLPRSPTPDVSQTPLAEQPVVPTLIASEQLLEQETAPTEDLAEAESRSQLEVLAQNLIEAPEDLAEVSEANAQILQTENENGSSSITQQTPPADPPQPNVLSAQAQVDRSGVQTPETLENLEPISEVRAIEDSEFIPEVATTEAPGSLPEAIPSQNPGVLPQTSEALLTELTESSEPLSDQSSDHLVNLPESVPQSFNLENLQVDSVQDAGEAREAVSPPIPETISAQTLLTSSEEVSEAIPAQTPEIPSRQDFETTPVENLEASAGQDLEAMQPEIPEIASRQDTEAISTGDPDISPRQIFPDSPAETLVGTSQLAPEQSITTSPEISRQVNLEDFSAPIPDAVSPESAEVLPLENLALSSALVSETSVESPEKPAPQVSTDSPESVKPEQTPVPTESTILPERPLAVITTFPSSEAALPSPEPLPETDTALTEQLSETTTTLSSAEMLLESAEELAPQSPEALSAAIPVETIPTDISSQIPESTSTETIDTTPEEQPSPLLSPQEQPTTQSVPETEATLPTERSLQDEPEEAIALNTDLQEQAQTLHAALANRLAQVDTPQPPASETPVASESSDAPEPEGSAVPESPLPISSLGDLAAQLDAEGQTTLTELISQADNVTPPSADLLASVTDRLPPDAVPALENIFQSGLLPPVVETQPQTQEPELATTASTDLAAEVPPLPPAILRGNAATSAFQGVQLPILTEAPPAVQELEDLEFPGTESSGSPSEDSVQSGSTNPGEASILESEDTTIPDLFSDVQILETPGIPEASPQLVDGNIQQVQDGEKESPVPQDDGASTSLLLDPGLGISPFLPIALDNLSTLTPLDLDTSPTAATFQDFVPLTFAPLPQAPVDPDPLFAFSPEQSPVTTQHPSATQRPEENQAVDPTDEQTSDLGLQTQELPLLSQTLEFEPSLAPEVPFPPGMLVGTWLDQEEAIFLGTMFASVEPLGQAAIESLVQMPEARQLEISNALPLARRPDLPTKTPSPQAPMQYLSPTALSPQPGFTDTPDLAFAEQPTESELDFEGTQQVLQSTPQELAPSYPQTASPLEFASLPQAFDQTTPATPATGYAQSTQPLLYRPTPTAQPDSSLGGATKSAIDQSGIEELLNLGTDNFYQEPEPPSFEDAPADEEGDTPLGQLFRQGLEQGQPSQRETITPEAEETASPTYTMEAPGPAEEDDDESSDGIDLESLARQIYYLVRQRIEREKERHGGQQDRGGW